MSIFQGLIEKYAEKSQEELPLNGCRIGIVHVFAPNTLPMLQVLSLTGAEIVLILDNGNQHDWEIVEFLKTLNLTIYDTIPETEKFDHIIDCGGFFTQYPPNIGGVEVTKSGIHRYRETGSTYKLIDVDNTRVKLIETFMGNPEAVYQTLDHFLGDARFFLEDAKIAIIGFGKIGRGSAWKFKKFGKVIVCDISEETLKFARSLEFETHRITDDIENNSNGLKDVDLIITATGHKGVMSTYFSKEELKNSMKINLGAVDEWGDKYLEDEIFHSKFKPFNFNLQPPTPSEYIDPILAFQVQALLHLVENQSLYTKGVNQAPEEMDIEIFNQFCEFNSVSSNIFETYFPKLFGR